MLRLKLNHVSKRGHIWRHSVVVLERFALQVECCCYHISLEWRHMGIMASQITGNSTVCSAKGTVMREVFKTTLCADLSWEHMKKPFTAWLNICIHIIYIYIYIYICTATHRLTAGKPLAWEPMGRRDASNKGPVFCLQLTGLCFVQWRSMQIFVKADMSTITDCPHFLQIDVYFHSQCSCSNEKTLMSWKHSFVLSAALRQRERTFDRWLLSDNNMCKHEW